MAQCVAEAATKYPGLPLTEQGANGPASACVPYGFDPNEIPADGLDNNCDGIYAGDESCNGDDEDNDGVFDGGQGACVSRHLFVPTCWTSPLPDFEVAVERWETFHKDQSLTTSCGDKFRFEAAPITGFCPPTTVDGLTLPETSAFMMALDDLAALPGNQHLALHNWDTVTFVQPRIACSGVGAYTFGDGVIIAYSDGAIPGDGEFTVWTHEYGHNLGLGEEYVEQEGKPNVIDAAAGCDPNDPSCCFEFTSGCTGDRRPICNGNRALDMAGWGWEDPALPQQYPDEGRCIMSFQNAPGWDHPDGDPVSGIGSHRSWCSKCLEHLRTRLPTCNWTYSGWERVLQAVGWLDLANPVMPILRVAQSSVVNGRAGAISGNSEWSVIIEEMGGDLIADFTLPDASAMHPETQVDTTRVPFWVRAPTDIPSSAPTRWSLVDANDDVVFQVSAGGNAPVAIADDIVAECAAGGASVVLDGSMSSDADGDTLLYAWSSNEGVIDDPATAVTAAFFPPGESHALLEVQDGTMLGSTLSIMVSVEDTTDPVFVSVPANLHITSCVNPNIGLAMAQDSCDGNVSITSNAPAKFPLGPTTVTWTATDAAGNTATTTQIVTASLADDPSCCPTGTNIMQGNEFANTINGTAGSDCILGKGGVDTLLGAGGDDFISGGAGTSDSLNGGAGNDVMYGNDGRDIMIGGSGNDTMYAENGADVVVGVSGNNSLSGGDGNDILIGGTGTDYINGEAGTDVCVGAPSDTLQNCP